MLTLVCVILYKQDQKTLQNISTNAAAIESFDIDYKTDISMIDISQPSFDVKDGSILSSVEWLYAYDFKEKRILWASGFIAVISKDKVSGYTHIPVNLFEFTPSNTMPSALLFQNPINIGMAVDEEDTPFFKYALLKKDSLLGGYHVSGYALCNALTYEIEYYEDLPDFVQ